MGARTLDEICVFPSMKAKNAVMDGHPAVAGLQIRVRVHAGYLTPKCTRRVIDTVVVVMEFTAQPGR
jgi:hypothetical protein